MWISCGVAVTPTTSSSSPWQWLEYFSSFLIILKKDSWASWIVRPSFYSFILLEVAIHTQLLHLTSPPLFINTPNQCFVVLKPGSDWLLQLYASRAIAPTIFSLF